MGDNVLNQSDMKNALLIIALLLLCRVLFAPGNVAVFVEKGKAIRPYDRIIRAIGKVESGNRDSVINYSELSYGRYQCRQIRLDDYFNRTGVRYCLPDMLDSVKSRKVIEYYANLYGVYRSDEFIKSWNGSGVATIKYLAKVRESL